MALTSDQHDILDVFLIANLANIANNSLFVAAPLGIQNFIDTVTVNNVNTLTFPSDLRQLLVNFILTRELQTIGRRNLLSRSSILEQAIF